MSIVGLYEDTTNRIIRNGEIPIGQLLGTGAETKVQYYEIFNYVIRIVARKLSELRNISILEAMAMTKGKVKFIFGDGNENGMEGAKKVFPDSDYRRCLQHIKANVYKAGREKLHDKNLAMECKNFTAWTAQLPILEFSLCWTNFLKRMRDEWKENDMADYLEKYIPVSYTHLRAHET